MAPHNRALHPDISLKSVLRPCCNSALRLVGALDSDGFESLANDLLLTSGIGIDPAGSFAPLSVLLKTFHQLSTDSHPTEAIFLRQRLRVTRRRSGGEIATVHQPRPTTV